MDAPDWLGIPGSSRYLGVVTIPSGNNQNANFNFSPQASDGAVLAFPAADVQASGLGFNISVSQIDLGVQLLYAQYGGPNLAPPSLFVAPIAAAMGPTWQLGVNYVGASGIALHYYVWAIPSFPALFAVDNNYPLAVQLRLGPNYYPGSGLPVAAARASASAVSTPAVGVQATVTFSAVAGRQYVVAEFDPSLTNNSAGAASIGDAVIRDGASGVGAVLFDVIAGVPIGYGATWAPTYRPPIAGTVGNAMTFEFVFPLAAAYERISASVYY